MINRSNFIAKMMKSTSLVMLLFLSFADATYLMVEGGYCMTYDSSSPNTLIKFEPCNFGDPRHNSWNFIPTGSSGASLVCLGTTNICDHVASDGKKYLVKKDATDVSQQWTGISGNRFTNGLTGPNMCAQAMNNADGDKVPDYIQMQPCGDNRKQQFLTFTSSSRLAQYFRDSFYLNYGPVAPFYSFPQTPVYPYIYPQPAVPYYQHHL